MPDTPTTGRATWFEVAGPDPARAAAFSGGLFGWAFHGDPAVHLSVADGRRGSRAPTEEEHVG